MTSGLFLTSRLGELRLKHSLVIESLSALIEHPELDGETAAELIRRIDEDLTTLDSVRDALGRIGDELRANTAAYGLQAIDWPKQHKALDERLSADLGAGITEWLRLVLSAAVLGEMRALDELVSSEVHMPPAAVPLVDRAAALRHGLASRSWELSHELLELAVDGPVGTALTLGDEDRAQLLMLLARLLCAEGRLDDAAASIERAASLGAPEGDVALVHARLARLHDEDDVAEQHLQTARTAGASAVGIVLEAFHQRDRLAGDTEAERLSAAEAEIWSLPTLADVESGVVRAVEPAPAVVWVAVARRRVAESDPTRAQAAIEQARAVIGTAGSSLLAELGELDVACLRQQDATPQRVRDAIVQAASAHIDLGHNDRALELLETGAQVVPGDKLVTLLQAEAIRLKVASQSISVAKIALVGALELAGTVPIIDGDDDLSWGFGVRSAIESALAEELEESSWIHRWRALRNAAWGVAFQPRVAIRWESLSTEAHAIGMEQLSMFAARLGRLLAQDDGDRLRLDSTYNVALANTGRLEEALARTADDADLSLHNVIGAVLGETAPLLDTLPKARTETFGPYDWNWLLLGLFAENDGRLALMCELATERAANCRDDTSWATVEVYALLVLGRFEQAATRGREVIAATRTRTVPPSNVMAFPAIAVFLADALATRRGDDGQTPAVVDDGHEDAFAMVCSAYALLTSLGDPAVWTRLERPAVRRFAESAGIELPEERLAELDRIVADRMGVLSARTVATELTDFELRGPDAAYSASTLTLVAAIVAFAEGDATSLLRLAEQEFPDASTSQSERLRTEAEKSAPMLRKAIAAERLETVAVADVPGVVEGLLSGEPAETVDLDVNLRNLELSPEVHAAVASSLTSIAAGDTDLAPRARFVVGYLGWPDAQAPSVASPWKLTLPVSWFAGIADPLHEHVIFRRWVPAIRTARSLPPLQVSTDEAFEPDRYEISYSGSSLERGTAPLDARWMLGAIAAQTGIAGATPSASGSPWAQVDNSHFDPIGTLLTIDTYEMLVRRVSELAAAAEAVKSQATAPATHVGESIGTLVDSVKNWWRNRRVHP